MGFYRREERKTDEFLEEAYFSPNESLSYLKIVSGKIGGSMTLSVFWPREYSRRHSMFLLLRIM